MSDGNTRKRQLIDNQQQDETTLWLSDIFPSDGHAYGRQWTVISRRREEKRRERNIAAVIWFRVFRKYDIRIPEPHKPDLMGNPARTLTTPCPNPACPPT